MRPTRTGELMAWAYVGQRGGPYRTWQHDERTALGDEVVLDGEAWVKVRLASASALPRLYVRRTRHVWGGLWHTSYSHSREPALLWPTNELAAWRRGESAGRPDKPPNRNGGFQ
jgi:hypothetical protein